MVRFARLTYYSIYGIYIAKRCVQGRVILLHISGYRLVNKKRFERKSEVL